MEMDVICKTWFCPALSSGPDHIYCVTKILNIKTLSVLCDSAAVLVPGIFMFQQTEFNFYGQSFKFIVMSEVKSVHNENEVSNTMKEVFALWKEGI